MSITRITGITSGLDTESLVKTFSSRYSVKKDKIWKQKQNLQYKQDAWKDMNKDIYNLYTNLFNNRLTSSYQKTEVKSSDEKIAQISGNNKDIKMQSLTVEQIASQTFLTGGKVDRKEPVGVNGNLKVYVGGSEKDINITPDMSMEQVARKLTEAGLVANFDENNMRMFVSSIKTGKDSDFSLGGDASLLDALGLGSSATKTNGQDALITLNGVQFESSNNNFNINGFNIEAKSIGSVSISSQSTNKIFDIVKDFIDQYNTLIKKIDTAYNTSAKGYDPLTAEEKESLNEKEIEEWDKKVKDGALYKDETLIDISNSLKNIMGSTSVDGINLRSLGLTLGDYFTTEKEERGVYQLDEDKLKSAISENPSKVINFMTKLSDNLYKELDKKMKSTSLSSVYTVYNDKQMKQEMKDYDNEISKWEKKIEEIEDKYYQKFAQMETMLSSIQNQNNYLTNFFGM